MLNRDKPIPGGCYEELFIDEVDGTRRKPSLEFYRILRELNVDTDMIVKKTTEIFEVTISVCILQILH